eukprot:CAMPEP_0174349974 /NCGR_PEP_ID=MMETSP0811_2-20130205/6879_1 /TAXON_ID=73025 ORGANISM="Eutreptiella gymnastica-like, Strain CCMP1594" /NCGR_SAMPLE_ID=MMETSP0811_2 /ASSEMBLY_ACC=CAM_ASM_000667 /LENGTH=77 /DNA_ID=CAMNT_0015477815 /DNA_START=176 /DNA_END=410 /DNA_ORIENTATION=+
MAMWHLQCALGSYMLHSIDLTIVVIPGDACTSSEMVGTASALHGGRPCLWTLCLPAPVSRGGGVGASAPRSKETGGA